MENEGKALFYFYSSYAEVVEELMKDGDYQTIAELVNAMGLKTTGRESEISFSSKTAKLLWISICPTISNSMTKLEKGREKSEKGRESVQRRKDRQVNVDERTSSTQNVDNVDGEQRTRGTCVYEEKATTYKDSNNADLYVVDGVPNLGKKNDLARCDEKPNLHKEKEKEEEKEKEKVFFINACAREEAERYHEEKKYTSDIQAWWDYWSVRNWEIGGKRLVNWKASIDSWENGYKRKLDSKLKSNKFNNFQASDIDIDELEKRVLGG